MSVPVWLPLREPRHGDRAERRGVAAAEGDRGLRRRRQRAGHRVGREGRRLLRARLRQDECRAAHKGSGRAEREGQFPHACPQLASGQEVAHRGALISPSSGAILAAILASASLAGWAALIAAIVGLLAFDLFFAHRGDDEVSLERAAGWSALWMVVGVAFGLVVLALIGSEAAGSYWAGFLMEKALSLDNVFVIAVLLGTFAVPQALKADVLTFGIAVALMLRTVFIVAGVTLLEIFHPAIYVMGALLIFTGIRLAIASDRPRTSPTAARCARCGACCRSARSTRARRSRARTAAGRHAAARRAARRRAGRRDLRDRLDPRRAGDHARTRS